MSSSSTVFFSLLTFRLPRSRTSILTEPLQYKCIDNLTFTKLFLDPYITTQVIYFFFFRIFERLKSKRVPSNKYDPLGFFQSYCWYFPPCGMMTYDGFRSMQMSVYLCCSIACFNPEAELFVMSLNFVMAAFDNLWHVL